MARNGSGVYSLPPGSVIANGDTSDASDVNVPLADIAADLNAARPITSGGTGATSASAARTALGLEIGADVQAYDAGLTAIAAITPADSTFLVGNGTTWVAESGSVARTSMGVPVVINVIGDATTANILSASATKTYVDGFTSAAQTIVAAELRTVAHGLPAAPGVISFRMVCNDAGGDNGYAENDVIYVGPGFNGTEVFRRGFAVYADATNVYVRFGDFANVVYYPHKTTGVWGPLDDDKWDFFIEARP